LRLGDLLIQAELVSLEQVTEALDLQAQLGGRLGDRLVAAGSISQESLDSFIHRMPAEPADLAAVKIDATELLGLLMKLIYVEHLETLRQFGNAIKLPYNIVLKLVEMAIDRQLMQALGSRDPTNPRDVSYTVTDTGRRWVLDALEQSRYAGPAPVTLSEFTAQVNLQKVTNERITYDLIQKSIGDLTFEDSIIEQSGPALNSGRAILLYGAPGNGKTSVAMCLANVFTDVIYIPYAVDIEGQIMRVFDPSYHIPLSPAAPSQTDKLSFVRTEEFDARWVPCRRPFVLTGGELTLEMLDLRYDPAVNFYEAPLHVKALGGCFLLDDFGRQLVSPTNLLNRWIVPLENRFDYLKLHTGKTFTIPFEELVIFSTNLEPEDLMDPAFLRRLPYKIEVAGPSLKLFKRIFDKECARQGMPLAENSIDLIVEKITKEKGLELAAYQPRFIVDQVAATCRFMNQQPHFEPRYIEYAINNLKVRRQSQTASTSVTAAKI
jgi:hypothetical protein